MSCGSARVTRDEDDPNGGYFLFLAEALELAREVDPEDAGAGAAAGAIAPPTAEVNFATGT